MKSKLVLIVPKIFNTLLYSVLITVRYYCNNYFSNSATNCNVLLDRATGICGRDELAPICNMAPISEPIESDYIFLFGCLIVEITSWTNLDFAMCCSILFHVTILLFIKLHKSSRPLIPGCVYSYHHFGLPMLS